MRYFSLGKFLGFHMIECIFYNYINFENTFHHQSGFFFFCFLSLIQTGSNVAPRDRSLAALVQYEPEVPVLQFPIRVARITLQAYVPPLMHC